MTTGKSTIVALIALALIACGLGAVSAQATASITLTPDEATPGTTITLDGSGFDPNDAGQDISIFLGEAGGTLLGVTEIANRDGDLVSVQFTVPAAAPGNHDVVVCRFFSSVGECRGPIGVGTLSILSTTTTTNSTTTTAVTTTEPPEATTTTEPGLSIDTTTSSLSFTVTTTTGVDPPAPMGPTGVAFTTTSTSLDVPADLIDVNQTHFPDIEITEVEVTQGIQDLQNRMPLVAGKRTVVRVYVAADRDEGGDIDDVVGGSTEDPGEVIGPEGWEPVDGLLHLELDGDEMIIYPVNAPITAYREGSQRLVANQTLNFEIPDGWNQSELEITAFVWSFLPETVITSEPDAGNNFATGTVVFHDAHPPQVVWFRLDTAAGPLSPSEYDTAMAAATESYVLFHPVAVPDFLPIFATLGPGPVSSDETQEEMWDFFESQSEPLRRMRYLLALWELEDGTRMHGLIPIETPSESGGLTHWSSMSAWSKPTLTTPAHEGAHMYFIQHAPCQDSDDDGLPDEVDGGGWGWIDQTYPAGLPSCSIAPEDPAGYYGVAIGPETELEVYSNDEGVPPVRYPFMGYEGPRWSDAYHMCRLMPTYDIGCNPESIGLTPKDKPGAPVSCGPDFGDTIQLDICLWNGQGNVDQQGGQAGSVQLVVSDRSPTGYLLVDVDIGAGQLGHAELMPVGGHNESDWEFIVERAKEGHMTNETMLRVTAADGTVLAQIPVSSHVGGHSAVTEVTTSVELIPWYEEAASLDLLRDDLVVDTRTSSNAPTVTIDPIDPQGSREFVINWTGSDPDGDPLLYTVSWSVDDGATWRPLDTQIPGTTMAVNDELVLAGGDVMVRVTASDGLLTGSAVAGPLEVPGGSPRGVLVAPESSPQYSSQRMRFTAHDPEDGPVTTGLWRSDIDGDLGEGPVMWMRDLSLGTHEITVTISDSDGNVVDLEATVEVVPGSLAAPRVEGEEPDAEMMVALGPARLDQFPLPEVETEESAVEEAPTGFSWIWAAIAGGLALVLTAGVILARRREVDG